MTEDRWDEWRTHLAERTAAPPLAELTPVDEVSPLLWAVPEKCGDRVLRWLDAAGRLHEAEAHARREFAGWIEQEIAEPRHPEDSAAFALTRLAWAHALPYLASVVSFAAWRNLLTDLIAITDEATAIPLDHDPLGRLLLAGETPWTLAYLFPELDACRRLAASAAATLSEGLLELLDGEGTPHSRHLSRLRPLLAMWTRCGLMARRSGHDCFTREAQEQFTWLVQRAMLMSRPDGGQLLSPGAEGDWREDLFEAALSVADDARCERLGREVLPLGRKKSALAAAGKAPPAAFHSEWSALGLLRREATQQSPRLLACYGERRLLAELTNRDEVIFTGAWEAQIEADGRRLTPESGWEEVCWLSDADLDYLELEMPLTGGWRVQRQMLLARKDEFLFAADALLGPGDAAKIDYRLTTPLARGVTFLAERETRDGVLEGYRKLTTVLPLALPEWRTDRRIGSLVGSAGGLELTMSVQGRALLAPLFFDLSKRRFKKDRTWRRLTVAERLEIVPSDVAGGFRVQVGKEQWLFYRSLAPSANRTVLGQNLASEFYAARFAKGECEELISVSTENS